ncbi:MAG: Rrf2 family transcriptional regulator [Anaerovoracaceae bacterium]|jgi:Rrf2 family protein
MQISSRFTIALHMFGCIEYFGKKQKVTSELMAASTGVNPVVIRRIMQQLREAGLIEVKRGSGGILLTRPLSEITFLDVFRAVDPIKNDDLFNFHAMPNPECPVGRNIHAVLDDRLQEVQRAMEQELASITLEEVTEDLEGRIRHE